MKFWEKLIPIAQEGWAVKMIPSSVVPALVEALKLLNNGNEESIIIDKNAVEDYKSSGVLNFTKNRLYLAMDNALANWNNVSIQFCKWWIGTIINWNSSFFSKDTKIS